MSVNTEALPWRLVDNPFKPGFEIAGIPGEVVDIEPVVFNLVTQAMSRIKADTYRPNRDGIGGGPTLPEFTAIIFCQKDGTQLEVYR